MVNVDDEIFAIRAIALRFYKIESESSRMYWRALFYLGAEKFANEHDRRTHLVTNTINILPLARSRTEASTALAPGISSLWD